MKFFFKRFRDNDDEERNMRELLNDMTSESTITNMVKSSIRSFLMDTQHPDAEKFIRTLEVGNVSDDVADMEWDASITRIEKLTYLFPAIESFASVYAKAWAASSAELALEGGQDLPDDFVEKTAMSLQMNLLACLVGSVSQLVDFELLQIPRRLP